jgi:hypothetical protein
VTEPVKKSKLSFIKRTGSVRSSSSGTAPEVRDRSTSSGDDSGTTMAHTTSSAAILALYEEDGAMSSLALLAECLRRSQQSANAVSLPLSYDGDALSLERLEDDDDDGDDDDEANGTRGDRDRSATASTTPANGADITTTTTTTTTATFNGAGAAPLRTLVHFLLRGFVVDTAASLDAPGQVSDADLIAACRKKLGSHLQFKVLRLTSNRCALLLPHVSGDDNPLRLATLSELADENVRLRHWLAATGDGRAALKELQDEFDKRELARRQKSRNDDGGGASDDEGNSDGGDVTGADSKRRDSADDGGNDEAAYERLLQRKFEAEAELAAWKDLLLQQQ